LGVSKDALTKRLILYCNSLLAFTRWESDGVSKFTIDLRSVVTSTHKRWLSDLGLSGSFAVITPCNPHGKTVDPERNDALMDDFAEALKGAGIDTLVRCAGVAPDLTHREDGYALLIDAAQALELAIEFEQVAFYWFDGAGFTIIPTEPDGKVITLPSK